MNHLQYNLYIDINDKNYAKRVKNLTRIMQKSQEFDTHYAKKVRNLTLIMQKSHNYVKKIGKTVSQWDLEI